MKFWIPSYTIDEVISFKKAIDTADNPAKGFILLKEIERKRVIVKKATVKQISQSTNIDYIFCVIATAESSLDVECYIYTRDWRNQEDVYLVAQLKPGDSIYVVGRFSRFLKLLGQQYAVELVESNIKKLR